MLEDKKRVAQERAPSLEFELGHLYGKRGSLLQRDELEPRSVDLFEAFTQELQGNTYPISLVLDEESLTQTRSLAQELRSSFDNVLVIGIGGSTLGLRAIVESLFPVGLDSPRVFVVENIDPALTAKLSTELDFSRTVVVYISKSGATPEPAANFLVFLDALRRQGADDSRIVICSSKDAGGAKRLVERLGCFCLEIPGPLPGRYSVLSCVGMFPAELLGCDAREFVSGARAVHNAIVSQKPAENPCYVLGATIHAYSKRGRNIHYLWSYADRLREFNRWFTQLWAESLGKERNLRGDSVRVGMTPCTALGATDQHSVLQLLRGGPPDKLAGFITVDRWETDVEVPDLLKDLDEYGYFGGSTLATQLGVEQRTTEYSLYAAGTPCYRMTLRDVSPRTLGALFYFWQALVVYMAKLDSIDPFDQPGVESGKEMTYALMGRGSFASKRREVEAALESYAESNVKFAL